MPKNLSLSEEDYLKAIYHLQNNGQNWINTNTIANELLISPSSVSDMLKKLHKQELLLYKAYYGCKLSAKGNILAVNLIRKHRLWECFLVHTLKFKWDEVHSIAEQLEHINSEELVNRLDDFLGNPTVDPHGDPIPNKKGAMPKTKYFKISELKKNQQAKIVRITNDSKEFLQMITKLNLVIGTNILFVEKHSFDNSIEMKINGKKNIFISKVLAEKILVELKN